MQYREVRKKDGAVRKAWNGKYHTVDRETLMGKENLGKGAV